MPTSSSTTWLPGFSENPDGEVLYAKRLVALLDLIGDELVAPPDRLGDPDAPRMTRRELWARVIWTRALVDADGTAIKLLIEHLDGKPGDGAAAPAGGPVFTADDMALAEVLLRAGVSGE
jgi:hypothetical protein